METKTCYPAVGNQFGLGKVGQTFRGETTWSLN